MTQTPKNPNGDRVADVPFDKDTVSPVPQYAPRTHGAGSSGAIAAMTRYGGTCLVGCASVRLLSS